MKKFLFLSVAAFGVFVTSLSATAKTLPQGVWSFHIHNQSFAVNQVAVDQGGPVWIAGSAFSPQHVDSLSTLVNLGFLDNDQQIVDELFYSITDFDITYGITDQLSAQISIPYYYKKLRYNDGYVSALETANGFNSQLDAAVLVPPSEVNTTGIGDLKLGLKYALTENTSFAAAYSGGFLLTGKDYNEVTERADGVQELNTGNKHDTIQVAAYHDTKIGDQPFQLMAAYSYYGEGGIEKVLDNDFEIDPGDRLDLVVGTFWRLNPEWRFDLIWDAIFVGTDKKKDNGSYVEIDHSATQANTLEFKFTYQPAQFIRAFASWRSLLNASPALGIYEIPGRLGAGGTAGPGGFYKFGVQVFYK